MKILFMTIGDETVASSRVRVYGYLPFLAKKSIKYKLISFTSRVKCRRILNLKQDSLWQYIFEIFYKLCVITKLFILARWYDIIFIQKVILPKIIWKVLKVLNKKIIFDFDDAIYLSRDIAYLLSNASCVIVSNTKLSYYAAKYNRNVFEVISPVNVSDRILPKRNNFVTVGWVGSPETSKYLYILLPVLKDLKNKFKNLNVEFIGAKRNRDLESLGVTIHGWSIEKQNRFLDEIDIGIMPLENDEWSWAKAGYKLLLYMSKGIPCVASPVGINSCLITNGENGYLAETPQEWLDKLSLMIEDYSLREQMGERGRKLAEKNYSYKVCTPIMLKILKGIKGA